MTFHLICYRSTGIYFTMFANVFTTVVKVTLFYLPILIGFSFGFFMLLPHNALFNKSLTSTLAVVVMMLGEFQFSDNFTWEKSMADAAVISNQESFYIVLSITILCNFLMGYVTDSLVLK